MTAKLEFTSLMRCTEIKFVSRIKDHITHFKDHITRIKDRDTH